MKPYYEHAGITIFHGDCRDILPSLSFDAVITDPPYGIDLRADYRATRANAEDKRAATKHRNAWPSKNHNRIHGDDKPFDPSPFLEAKYIALCGANNFASRLPDRYSWLVWDKKTERGAKSNFGDCELIYCSGAEFESVRIFRHMWCGYQRDSEVGNGSLHPTQKPIALMQWVLTFFPKATAILDPFMGSGSTLVAAKMSNIKAIGIEIEEKYCEIAAKRLQQQVFDFGGPINDAVKNPGVPRSLLEEMEDEKPAV